jgi:hypothetical protein
MFSTDRRSPIPSQSRAPEKMEESSSLEEKKSSPASNLKESELRIHRGRNKLDASKAQTNARYAATGLFHGEVVCRVMTGGLDAPLKRSSIPVERVVPGREIHG